jgi:hypothetical protein
MPHLATDDGACNLWPRASYNFHALSRKQTKQTKFCRVVTGDSVDVGRTCPIEYDKPMYPRRAARCSAEQLFR